MTTHATMPKNGGANFKFLNIQQPAEGRSGRFRRQVRSHVTALQHRRIRTEGSQCQANICVREDSKARSSAECSTATRTAATREESDVSTVATERIDAQHGDFGQSDLNAPVRMALERKRSNSEDRSSFSGSHLAISFSRGTMYFRTFALNDSANIVGQSLRALELDMSAVLSCYKLMVQVLARDFEQKYACVTAAGSIMRGSSWERFFSFIFLDPVLLTVAIILSVRYQLTMMRGSLEGKDLDASRSTSDPMLVAVALCAAYEVKYGSIDSYRMHMRGLVCMVQLRGGLRALGSQDPYLELMLIWHDVNTSQILEEHCYFADMPSSLQATPPEANVPLFRRPIHEDPMLNTKV